jgi:glycosyl hydrolase family 2
MRRRRQLLIPLALLALAAPAAGPARAADPGGGTPTTPTTPPPPAPPAATVPNGAPLYADGQDGRVVVNGPWLFRLDPLNVGLNQLWFAQHGTSGWSPATVPSAWNARDDSLASFTGGIAWYRKDFRLPSAKPTLSWIARFESANFRATVWLNGRRLFSHAGGYDPFELDLPNLHRKGVNRLVVRIDNRRGLADLSGAAGDQPIPPGGWWNYGGLLREVYLRRVDRVDLTTVQVVPTLPCARCGATIATTATVRNVTRVAQRVKLQGRFGKARLSFPVQVVFPGQIATFTAARLRVRHPRLWSPESPYLYGVRLAASALAVNARGHPRATPAAAYSLHTGIRSLRVDRAGELLLNGRALHFKGAALHEDTLTQGAAMDNATRAHIVAVAKDMGATLIRSHYPLHPQFQELADRKGLLLWSEIPATYQLPDPDLGKPQFRALAFQELTNDVVANRNHPSVAVWSVGNEMPSSTGPNQQRYVADAAALVRQLDPTRPVGLAFAGHPEAPCQATYAPLDVLGMNDYFGWYTGFGGNIADRDNLSAFLDQLRRCYPSKAIAVTEYGAEANRDGPVEEKGTFAFQSDFIQFHANVFASKPWLAGSTYWALQEFRVRPGWGGGNPWGTPPYHTKGLIRLDFSAKPGFETLKAAYRGTR